MQTPVKQLVAITNFGNLFLRKAENNFPLNFYPSNSTFKYCKSVDFVCLKQNGSQWKEFSYAADPAAFLNRMLREGYRGMRLHNRPADDKDLSERQLTGIVGGGGRWLLETVSPSGSDYWESHWTAVTKANTDVAGEPKDKIWQVSYGRIATGITSLLPSRPNLELLIKALSQNLSAIGLFAREHGQASFATSFEAGLAWLEPEEIVDESPLADMAPPGLLPLNARKLLGAAQSAWVFGGTGSWNELSFEKQDQGLYEKLTEELYRLLNAAILAATNSSFKY